MNAALLLLSIGIPLIVAAAVALGRDRNAVLRFASWAALPALIASVVMEPTTVQLSWVLLGSHIGLDLIARVFLGVSSLLWLLAGIYASSYMSHDPARRRFFVFYLVTMVGNFGLIIAQDMPTFFLFYALMSFSAYGLITHTRRPEDFRAGRIYLVLVVFGEVLIFSGIVLAASQTGTLLFENLGAKLVNVPSRDLILVLVVVGFSIKLGVMPLHFWLPLAHPVAPTPASAVLSGAMIKAGLVGWLRFLPLGELAMPNIGVGCLAIGLITAFCGVLIGLTQKNPKTVLAYSSVSQMGLITVGIGVGMTTPDAWPGVLVVLFVYAMHHAVSKCALFLGVGVAAAEFHETWQRRLVCLGLALPALALAGAPLTSGAIAKLALKSATVMAPIPWPGMFKLLLPISSVATALLMCRFLYLVWPGKAEQHGKRDPGLWIPWAILSVGAVGLVIGFRLPNSIDSKWVAFSLGKAWQGLWPVGAGGLLAVAAIRWQAITEKLQRVQIPSGDLVVPLTWLLRYTRNGLIALIRLVRNSLRYPCDDYQKRIVVQTEKYAAWLAGWLENLTMAGILAAVLAIILVIALSV